MAKIVVTTSPVDIEIDGEIIWFLGDPSSTEGWNDLMELDTSYKTKAERDAFKEKVSAALQSFCADEESLERFTAMDLGVITLKNLGRAYVEEVSKFPTQPSKPSTKR